MLITLLMSAFAPINVGHGPFHCVRTASTATLALGRVPGSRRPPRLLAHLLGRDAARAPISDVSGRLPVEGMGQNFVCSLRHPTLSTLDLKFKSWTWRWCDWWESVIQRLIRSFCAAHGRGVQVPDRQLSVDAGLLHTISDLPIGLFCPIPSDTESRYMTISNIYGARNKGMYQLQALKSVPCFIDIVRKAHTHDTVCLHANVWSVPNDFINILHQWHHSQTHPWRFLASPKSPPVWYLIQILTIGESFSTSYISYVTYDTFFLILRVSLRRRRFYLENYVIFFLIF